MGRYGVLEKVLSLRDIRRLAVRSPAPGKSGFRRAARGTASHAESLKSGKRIMDFISISLLDVVDVLVVALLFYQVYRMIRGTAAMTIFAGIFIVYLLWVVVKALNMTLLSSIMGQVIGVGVLALIIVFQQEVRRYLLLLGSRYSRGG